MYCHKEQIINAMKNMMHKMLRCYDYTIFGSNMVVSVVMKKKVLTYRTCYLYYKRMYMGDYIIRLVIATLCGIYSFSPINTYRMTIEMQLRQHN